MKGPSQGPLCPPDRSFPIFFLFFFPTDGLGERKGDNRALEGEEERLLALPSSWLLLLDLTGESRTDHVLASTRAFSALLHPIFFSLFVYPPLPLHSSPFQWGDTSSTSMNRSSCRRSTICCCNFCCSCCWCWFFSGVSFCCLPGLSLGCCSFGSFSTGCSLGCCFFTHCCCLDDGTASFCGTSC